MDRSLDLTQDAQRLRESAVHLESTITALLKQIGECAIFVCEYLKSNFAGKRGEHGLTVQ